MNKKYQFVFSGKEGIVYIGVLSLLLLGTFGFLFRTTQSFADDRTEKVNCDSFKGFANGYEMAQLALKNNPRLDGDKDGIACQSLKTNK